MNIKLKLLFKQLNEYRSAGALPDTYTKTSDYFDIQKKVLAEISAMSSEEAIGLIDELSDTQIKQIVPLVEYIIKIHPQTRFVFKNINEERNIYCLDNELKTLGLI